MSKSKKKTENLKSIKAPDVIKTPDNESGLDKKTSGTPGEKKRKAIVLTALILAAVLLVSLIVTLIVILTTPKEIDYLKDDLSKYVYISGEKYKDFGVDISIREPGNIDVEFEIMKKLYAYRERVGDAELKDIGTLGVGDKTYIYFLGYTKGEDGEKIPFSGGYNFDADEPYELQLGSGSFVTAGFEYGLVGKDIESYPKFERIESGNVADGQVLYISFDGFTVDGKSDSSFGDGSGLRLDLREDIDAEMGSGFKQQILGKEIGKELNMTITTAKDGKQLKYYNPTVSFATECEVDPIVVVGYFPYNYSEASLRSQKVYFDVYVQNYVDYEVPEFNDTFITEEIIADDPEMADVLAEYDGADLAEKCRKHILSILVEEYKENRSSLVEDAIWAQLAKNLEIKKYPKANVDAQYELYLSELQTVYNYGNTSYPSLGAFIRAYYGLSASADWQAYLKLQAENAVAQKMMFYYIIRNENWLPSGEEYDRLYNEAVDYELQYESDYIACKREDYTSDEAYNSAVATIKRNMITRKGELHFADSVYFEYGMKKIAETVTVNDK